MQKIIIIAPLFTVEIEGETPHELFKAAAFWQSLPKKCPKCGSPLILDYMQTPREHYDYFKLKCIGSPAHAVNLGQKTGTLQLYYDAKKPWDVFRPGQVDEAEQVQGSATPAAALPAAAEDGSASMLAALRNKLIKTIADAKAAGIRTRINPPDVGRLSEADLRSEDERIQNLLANAEVGRG